MIIPSMLNSNSAFQHIYNQGFPPKNYITIYKFMANEERLVSS